MAFHRKRIQATRSAQRDLRNTWLLRDGPTKGDISTHNILGTQKRAYGDDLIGPESDADYYDCQHKVFSLTSLCPVPLDSPQSRRRGRPITTLPAGEIYNTIDMNDKIKLEPGMLEAR